MTYPATAWYVNSVAWSAVTAWAAGATIAAGALRRQSATPSVGNERVFVAIVGGTTNASTEPTWVLTRGGKTTDNTVTWQECTGQAGVNGDITNTPSWLTGAKSTTPSLGVIIKDAGATHLFICSTSGAAGTGSEPSWNTAAVGNTTADASATWTYIGLASSFGNAAAPHARLSNALTSTWSAATDRVYVGDNHAETSASTVTITGASAIASATQNILCHGHAGTYPPMSSSDLGTGATITGTTISWSSANIYVRGIESIATSGGVNYGQSTTTGNFQRFELCPMTMGAGALSTAAFVMGNTSYGSRVIHDNCTMTFNNAGQNVQVKSTDWEWRSSSVTGTAPTVLVSSVAYANAWVHSCDLNAIGSGKKLVALPGGAGFISFDRCKIDNAVTVATVSALGSQAILSKCDAGAVNYRDEVYQLPGALTTEATIVRSGGQSDGTTPISRKAVTGSSSAWAVPFECPPIAIWNETVGSSITITLYGIWGGGAVPNNDDFWIDVEYFGTGGDPISSRATSGLSNILAGHAALTSDASSWGGSTTAFTTSVTITPQMKGYIIVQPKIAKASSTFYYDTKLGIS